MRCQSPRGVNRGELRVNVSYDEFIKVIRQLIAGIEVDEDWYLKQYEDIAKAIREGSVKSARQHFIDDGYFEGRLPFQIKVDERWYLANYPDIADSIRRGDVPNGQTHYEQNGYKEGRRPFA